MTAAAKSPKGGAVPIILLAGHSYGQYTLGDDANIPKIQSKGGAQFRSLLIESYSGTARKQNMTLLGRQPKKPKRCNQRQEAVPIDLFLSENTSWGALQRITTPILASSLMFTSNRGFIAP